jgi:hypothetical protein
MKTIADWRGHPVEVVTSAGGVRAVVDPWDGLIRTGISPWPPPELIQKLYQSRHSSAFRGDDSERAVAKHGFYSDLQSLRSEDGLTWSVFDSVVYADAALRVRFVTELLEQIGVSVTKPRTAVVWLWRRLPHPDTLVPGGPEIDFGIQTEDVFVLGEAKWLSGIGAGQGAGRDQNQIQLRNAFCEKYGRRLLPNCKVFVVLGASIDGDMLTPDFSSGRRSRAAFNKRSVEHVV